MSKTRPYGADRCPNCGEYGAHYCGPSFGEPAFFICKPKGTMNIPSDQFPTEDKEENHEKIY